MTWAVAIGIFGTCDSVLSFDELEKKRLAGVIQSKEFAELCPRCVFQHKNNGQMHILRAVR